MKRITKDDSKRKLELVKRLTITEAKLAAAIEVFNGVVTDAWIAVETAQSDYNDVVQESNGFMSDIASEIDGYIDERSDKWREGEAAASYEEWKSGWETELDEAALDEPEMISTEFDVYAADVLPDLEDEVAL